MDKLEISVDVKFIHDLCTEVTTNKKQVICTSMQFFKSQPMTIRLLDNDKARITVDKSNLNHARSNFYCELKF